MGRKHEPVFRLVLTDSKNSTKSGKLLEILGNFDARRGEKAEFKGERVSYWISKGAQATPTVHNLLIDKKIIEGKKINNLPLKKPIVKDATLKPAKTPETPNVTGGGGEEKEVIREPAPQVSKETPIEILEEETKTEVSDIA